jgi:hypothetical protein
MNLRLTEKSKENIAFIMAHQDIETKQSAVRQALNYFAMHLVKEDAKINNYSKSAKTGSVVEKKVTKAETDFEEGKNLCVLDFEGVITDEHGNEDPNGIYCKYDSYEKLTNKKFYVARDMVNPIERLSGLLNSGEKYRNTNKMEVDSLSQDESVAFVELNGKDD